MTGYSVRTGEGLRYFRDTTLADAAAAIEDLRRKIDATHIPTGAWPKAAAGRQSDYTTTINAMLDDTGRLTSLNDRHIDGITATAAGYDDAENATLTAVTGHAATHGTGGTTAATARPVAATTGVPATTGSGDVGPGAVLAMFAGLDRFCSAIGLGSIVHPACQTVADNARDPAPFRRSAAQNDLVAAATTAITTQLATGLERLNGHWAGQAGTAHGTITADYDTYLAGIADTARRQAAAATKQAATQSQVNTIWLVIGILIGTLAAALAIALAYTAWVGFTAPDAVLGATQAKIAVAAAALMVVVSVVCFMGGLGMIKDNTG